MFECNYGLEAYDRKLNAILFIRKIWIILVAAVAGALVSGSVYFIMFILFAPEPQYRTYSMLYVDFVEGEDGPQYYTFNDAGWAGFVKTDVILDYALDYRDSAGEDMNLFTKEELRKSVSAGTDADYRIVELEVTNLDPEIALEMAHDMEQGFIKFAGDMRECEQIRIMTQASQAKMILVDDNTVRVTLWGAFVLGCFAWMGIVISISLDDSVYIPDTFEKRYGINVIGVLMKPGIIRSEMKSKDNKTDRDMEQVVMDSDQPDMDLEQETLIGMKQFLSNHSEFAFTAIEGNTRQIIHLKKQLISLVEQLGIDKEEITTDNVNNIADTTDLAIETTDIIIDNVIRHPGYIDEIKTKEAVVLVIQCGARNGKRIEKAIRALRKQNVEIAGAILTDLDTKLLHQYYFHLFGKRNEE